MDAPQADCYDNSLADTCAGSLAEEWAASGMRMRTADMLRPLVVSRSVGF
jgi:hypothetical protein